MFDRDSRYADIETVHVRLPDGRSVPCKRRRFLPLRPPSPSDLSEVVSPDERIDLFTSRVLGPPEDFWRLADANPLLNIEEPDQPRGAARRVPLDPSL